MSVEGTFTPPQDAGVENEVIGFDYGLILASGEVITSVQSIACAVDFGVDPSPSSRLTSGTSIVASTKTGAPSAQVNVKFGGALAGVTYRIQCVVNTLQTGGATQVLSIIAFFAGVAPPGS